MFNSPSPLLNPPSSSRHRLTPTNFSSSETQRLSEYSPLIGFHNYYFQNNYNPNAANNNNPKSIYWKLFGLIAITAAALLIGGIILFDSHYNNNIDPNNPQDSLAPIVFVPDLFCSQLEIRIKTQTNPNDDSSSTSYNHDDEAHNLDYKNRKKDSADANSFTFEEKRYISPSLHDCPRWLTEWTNIYNYTLQSQYPNCLIQALISDYNPEQHTFVNRLGIDIRPVYSNQGGLKGLVVTPPDDEDGNAPQFNAELSAQSNSENNENKGRKSNSDAFESVAPCQYQLLLSYLHSVGYVEHVNLHAVPYDWRQSSLTLNDASAGSSSFFSRLQALIERSYHTNHARRVVILSNGAGSDHSLTFLRLQDNDWKKKFLAGFIALSGEFAGNMENLLAVTTGRNNKANSMFPTDIKRQTFMELYQSMEYYAYKLPFYSVFGEDNVLLTTPTRRYTSKAADLHQLLVDCGALHASDIYINKISPIQQQISLSYKIKPLTSQYFAEITQIQSFSPIVLYSSRAEALDYLNSLNTETKKLNSTHKIRTTSDNLAGIDATRAINPFLPPTINTFCLYPGGIDNIIQFIFKSDDFSDLPDVIYAPAKRSGTEKQGESGQTKRNGKKIAIQSSSLENSSPESSSDSSGDSDHYVGSGDSDDLDDNKDYDSENVSPTGVICKHWNAVINAAQLEKRGAKHDEGMNSDAPELLLGAVPASTSLLPSKHRTIRAIHFVLSPSYQPGEPSTEQQEEEEGRSSAHHDDEKNNIDDKSSSSHDNQRHSKHSHHAN
jgi:hypothetical protein